jgi:hypothetical protein
MPFSEAPFSAIFQPLLSFFNFSGHVYIRLFQSSVVFHSSYFFNLNGVCGLPKGAKRPTKPLTLPIHSYGVLYLSCFCSSSGRGVVLYLALFRGSLWPFLVDLFSKLPLTLAFFLAVLTLYLAPVYGLLLAFF